MTRAMKLKDIGFEHPLFRLRVIHFNIPLKTSSRNHKRIFENTDDSRYDLIERKGERQRISLIKLGCTEIP